MLFNFCLFRLRYRPFVRRPLSSHAIVVRPPPVVASFAACSPRIVSYRPLRRQHRCQHRHCILILPPPSFVTRRAVQRPLLPQPTAVVDQPLRSSCFFVSHLLSFLSLPVCCLLGLSLSGPAKGGGWMPPAGSLFQRSDRRMPV